MAAPTIYHHQSIIKKTRRRHQKSRNGCLECKRRRIKCDEAKPSCERCVLSLYDCVYPPPQSVTSNEKDEEFQRSFSRIALLPSPESSTYSETLPSSESSTCSPLGSMDHYSNITAETLNSMSEEDLYHHYLSHTSRTLAPGQRGQSALQIDLPALASESRTVLHSILAVSAVCVCCDMIAKETEISTSAIRQLLMVGYRHYNLASEQMRDSMSKLDTLKPDHLLASAVLMVPFATASQQVNHWISKRISVGGGSTRLLLTTPRDAIVLMRGIQTTIRTLCCGTPVSSPEVATESDVSTCSPSAESSISSTLPPPRTHVMFEIVSTTSQYAFLNLQQRIDSAAFSRSEGCDEDIEACKAAFKALNSLRTRAFSSTKNTFDFTPALLHRMPPWLQSIANRASNPLPHETLTSFFLSFLVQVPQAYLNLVLPLLDQRLENPIAVSTEASHVLGLNAMQALALDIYAHWSVLMFLAEDRSWWIGNLPEVTLSGLVNAYGDDFVSKLIPGSFEESGKWWPGSMLKILREVKKFR